jgi:hypothetical protein
MAQKSAIHNHCGLLNPFAGPSSSWPRTIRVRQMKQFEGPTKGFGSLAESELRFFDRQATDASIGVTRTDKPGMSFSEAMIVQCVSSE